MKINEEVEIVGINGGDGTIHVTLSTFLRVYDGAPFPSAVAWLEALEADLPAAHSRRHR